MKQIFDVPVVLLLLAVCSTSWANCFAPPAEQMQNSSEREFFLQATAEHKQAQKRNRALCLIHSDQIESVFSKPPQLIDVRKKAGPRTPQIRGALKIPLYEIKLKSFLKSRPFVIVGTGIERNHLLQTCGRLQRKGFKGARVLLDGSRAWTDATADLRPTDVYMQDSARITPEALFIERNDRDWLIVNLSDYTSARLEQYFEAGKIISGEPMETSIQKHLAGGHQHSPPAAVLFVDKTGEQRGRVPPNLWDNPAVYYLRGGQAAFEDYLHKQYIIASKSEYNLQKPRSCRP